MSFTGAEKIIRWVPTSFLMGRMGVPRSVRKPYLDANADVAALVRPAWRGASSPTGCSAPWSRVCWPRAGTPQLGLPVLVAIRDIRVCGALPDVPFFFDCLDGPAMEPLAGPNRRNNQPTRYTPGGAVRDGR